MTFDPLTGLVLLVGGWSAAGYSGETWGWDGESWSLLASDSFARRNMVIAYHEELQRVVMQGGVAEGERGEPLLCGDTWLWDGDSWSVLTDFGAAPRFASAAAYDSLARAVVLFGGSDGTTDLQTWTLLPTGPGICCEDIESLRALCRRDGVRIKVRLTNAEHDGERLLVDFYTGIQSLPIRGDRAHKHFVVPEGEYEVDLVFPAGCRQQAQVSCAPP